jgi:hypothetical protein
MPAFGEQVFCDFARGARRGAALELAEKSNAINEAGGEGVRPATFRENREYIAIPTGSGAGGSNQKIGKSSEIS